MCTPDNRWKSIIIDIPVADDRVWLESSSYFLEVNSNFWHRLLQRDMLAHLLSAYHAHEYLSLIRKMSYGKPPRHSSKSMSAQTNQNGHTKSFASAYLISNWLFSSIVIARSCSCCVAIGCPLIGSRAAVFLALALAFVVAAAAALLSLPLIGAETDADADVDITLTLTSARSVFSLQPALCYNGSQEGPSDFRLAW